MWSRIYDLIIKAILSGEHYVNAAMKKYNLHRNNCFEVFGYDVILDSELKPWLLEVNLSPSLACESPLDLTIKSTLLADTFNMIGVSKFDRRKESLNKIKNRGGNAPKSNTVQNNPMNQNSNDIFLNSQTHYITPQVSQLIERLIEEES
jgi:tubulin polyglutamylase TTLL5